MILDNATASASDDFYVNSKIEITTPGAPYQACERERERREREEREEREEMGRYRESREVEGYLCQWERERSVGMLSGGRGVRCKV